MCRGINHTGVRCPSDTSAARQQRRVTARSLKRNANRVKEHFVAGAPDDSAQFVDTIPMTAYPLDAPIEFIMAPATLETVKNHVSMVDTLVEAHEKLEKMGPTPGGTYETTINGSKVRGSKTVLLDKLTEAQEIAVTRVGSEIMRLVDSRTGSTEVEVREKYGDAANKAIQEFTDTKKALEAKTQEFIDVVPNNIKVMSHMIETRLKDKITDEKKAALVKALHDEAKKYEEQVAAYPDLVSNFHEAFYGMYALRERMAEVQKRSASIIDYGDEEVVALNAQRIQATKDILASVRPMGGTVTVLPESQKAGVKVLQEAAKLYPQAWVNEANAQKPVIVKFTEKRAHYDEVANHKTNVASPIIMESIKPVGWVPNPRSSLDYGYVEVNPATNEYYNEEFGHTVKMDAADGYKPWVYTQYNHFVQSEDKMKTMKDGSQQPVGRGWIQQEFDIETNNWSTGEKTVRAEKVWIRKATRKREKVFSAPEITVNDSATPYHAENGYRVAVHEFAHRMEHVGSKFVPRMEEQFLKRRTTSYTGEREKLQRAIDLAPNSSYSANEVVRPDNFTNLYMGKEYTGSHFREVLSMGMEAIFSGSQGGLQGFGNYKPDLNMKNFIVGLLASGK